MSRIEQSIAAIVRVHDRIGSRELAKVAGVPYTTVRAGQARRFVGKPILTLIKLAAAAEQIEAAESGALA